MTAKPAYLAVLLLLVAGSDRQAYAAQPQGPTLSEQPMVCVSPPANINYQRSLQDYPLPPVVLRGMDDTDVPLTRVLADDGPVVVNFIFTTCPTVCPVLSATFANFQQQLSTTELAQTRLVSISIDPEHDTPARLREYAATFGAGPGWQFYTGDLETVVTVQKAFDAYRGSKMNHAPLTFMRASADAPWLRLEGFLKSSELLSEYRALTIPDSSVAVR